MKKKAVKKKKLPDICKDCKKIWYKCICGPGGDVWNTIFLGYERKI